MQVFHIKGGSMRHTKATKQPLSLMYKLGGGLLIGCLLILGVIGLIMPILPGILFFFLALYVLTRLSRRAAAYAHTKPWFRYHLLHLQAASGLSMGARMKLGALIVARGTVQGIETVLFWCKRRLGV
jgi:uncharacterized membrane protein YbaN (DUF454 family)